MDNDMDNEKLFGLGRAFHAPVQGKHGRLSGRPYMSCLYVLDGGHISMEGLICLAYMSWKAEEESFMES